MFTWKKYLCFCPHSVCLNRSVLEPVSLSFPEIMSSLLLRKIWHTFAKGIGWRYSDVTVYSNEPASDTRRGEPSCWFVRSPENQKLCKRTRTEKISFSWYSPFRTSSILTYSFIDRMFWDVLSAQFLWFRRSFTPVIILSALLCSLKHLTRSWWVDDSATL